ncbi:MAG: 8-oxo-dGTP diphosphatase MutT [Lachnospiraceae bacterium]|nr:8-oxo-dGTP diphosphatase MutT [Lachnospiraceae bacterium]
MKSIKVVAAVIKDNNKIFATKRKPNDFAGGWEFPGGKVEPHETRKQALRREIMEELDTEIKVGDLLVVVEHDYPTFHLTMHVFMCSVFSGDLTLKEHEAARWLTREELDSVNWLPADVKVVEALKKKWSDN